MTHDSRSAQPPDSTTHVRGHAVPALLIVGLATIALCLYQWIELVQLQTAHARPACSINETFDCAAVWNSPLAQIVHQYTGLPFAGWGLAWGCIVSFLATRCLMGIRRGRDPAAAIQALRIVSAGAVLASIALLVYSVAIKIVCPTCLGFYILAGMATWISYRHINIQPARWKEAALLTLGSLFISYGILLYPGIKTPFEPSLGTHVLAGGESPDREARGQDDALARFLASQSAEVKQYISNYLAEFRRAEGQPIASNPDRLSYGSADAPLHLVEWLEIQCPHCRRLEDNLTQIRSITPAGSWGLETRFFPLDSECNPDVKRSSGTGVSCLAARLLICLAGTPDANRVREALLRQQRTLSNTETVWQISEQNGVSRKSLEQCVGEPETEAQLQQDIRLANRYHISGTPLVVANGREVAALPHLILALILAQGRDDDPAFKVLPPPQPLDQNR